MYEWEELGRMKTMIEGGLTRRPIFLHNLLEHPVKGFVRELTSPHINYEKLSRIDR